MERIDLRRGGRKHHLLCVLCMGNCSKEWEKGIGTSSTRGVFSWGGEEEGES